MTAETVAGMIAEARQQIENLTPDAARREYIVSDVVLVDIRESEERALHGAIPGAIHAPRGMLEFYADSTSPYHREEFDPEQRLILYCASGGRSALGASALRQLGFRRVAHLDGGYTAWRAAGHPTAPA